MKSLMKFLFFAVCIFLGALCSTIVKGASPQMTSAVIGGTVAGLACALIPYFYGRRKHPAIAAYSFLICGVSGAFLGLILALPVSLAITGVIAFKKQDADPTPPESKPDPEPQTPSVPQPQPAPVQKQKSIPMQNNNKLFLLSFAGAAAFCVLVPAIVLLCLYAGSGNKTKQSVTEKSVVKPKFQQPIQYGSQVYQLLTYIRSCGFYPTADEFVDVLKNIPEKDESGNILSLDQRKEKALTEYLIYYFNKHNVDTSSPLFEKIFNRVPRLGSVKEEVDWIIHEYQKQ